MKVETFIMKRKIIFCLLLTLLIALSTSLVLAITSHGTIYSWLADDNKIARWTVTPQIYEIPLNTTDAQSWLDYVMPNAIGQWNDVNGLTIGTTTSAGSEEITVYCGTLAEIQNIYASFPSASAGRTLYPDETYVGYWNLYENGHTETRYEYEFNSNDEADVYLRINTSYNTSERKFVAAHEIGHSIGFHGHNPASNELMYGVINSDYILSNDEEEHMELTY